MNAPNPIIERNPVQPKTPAERPRLPPPRHRNPLAILLLFAGVALVWLAVMWGIFEVMHLDSGQPIIPAS